MEISQKAKNRSTWAWRDGFIGQVFDTEVWGPMFDPRSQINKLSMVVYICNLCAVEAGQVEPWNSLASQHSLISDF